MMKATHWEELAYGPKLIPFGESKERICDRSHINLMKIYIKIFELILIILNFPLT